MPFLFRGTASQDILTTNAFILAGLCRVSLLTSCDCNTYLEYPFNTLPITYQFGVIYTTLISRNGINETVLEIIFIQQYVLTDIYVIFLPV